MATSIQGLRLFSNFQVVVTGGNLVVRNLSTGLTYGKLNAVVSTTDRYQIVIQKLVDISIVLINTNPATTEDIVALEFITASNTFVVKSFTGLSNKNFKCGAFFEGKLLLGGNPAAPAVLYYSKTFSALSLANIYDFSAYNAGSQPIGDGESIVAFASNNTEFFIFKKNSIFKITGNVDNATTPSFVYTIRQETSTGAINQFSISNVEKDIIYSDGSTIRRISYEAQILALSDSAIGKDIELIPLSLTQSQELNSFSVYSYPYVKFFLRSNTSTVNDFALLYNVVDKSFSIQSGIDGNVGTDGKVNNVRTAYIGSQFESTIYKDNVGMDYNGGDISFSGLSKKINMGDGVNYNQWFEFEMKGTITIGLPVDISILIDGKVVTTKRIDSSSSTNLSPTMGSTLFGAGLLGTNSTLLSVVSTPYELKIPLYNTGRELSYSISGIGQGLFEISGTTVTFARTKGYNIV